MLAVLSVVAVLLGGTMFVVGPVTDDSVASAQQEQAKVAYVAQNVDSQQPRL
jgi:type II secretory pathway pseudopilin PulG